MSSKVDKIISKAKTLHTNDIQTIICFLQIEIDEREDKDEWIKILSRSSMSYAYDTRQN